MLDEIKKNPVEAYQRCLLSHLVKIYRARKETNRTDWTKYSDLLIDKFAIHSSTLFHLIHGIIEHQNSEPDTRKASFDLFSVNSLLRTLIESYITFNHIYVSAKTEDEKEFRFLLWQLDGLLEQRKFRIDNSDFGEAEQILHSNQERIQSLFNRIESTNFFKIIPQNQLIKVFDRDNKKVNWKYKITDNLKISPLKIIDLVECTCVARSFVNLYKYTSIHTHTGFVSIEHFEKMRGKQVSDEYVNPLVTNAIILTLFLIKDVCTIDKNAQKAFLIFSEKDQKDIIGINKQFRKI